MTIMLQGCIYVGDVMLRSIDRRINFGQGVDGQALMTRYQDRLNGSLMRMDTVPKSYVQIATLISDMSLRGRCLRLKIPVTASIHSL